MITKTEFERLDKSIQRKMIVSDAIAQLRSGKMQGSTGLYMGGIDDDEFKPIKDLILENDFSCYVCAKGSLFAGLCLNDESITPRSVADKFLEPSYIRSYTVWEAQRMFLKEWFSDSELDLMEMAFEGRCIVDNCNVLGGTTTSSDEDEIKDQASEIGKKALEFYHRYSNNSHDRLLAILENIQEHGEFKP